MTRNSSAFGVNYEGINSNKALQGFLESDYPSQENSMHYFK